jgi:hypothetical protein
MADCFSIVSGQLVQQIAPANLSTCQNVLLSGSDYLLFQNAVEASSVPYDAVQGALIFSAFFVPTLTMYLFVRSGSEILRIIRSEMNNFFK